MGFLVIFLFLWGSCFRVRALGSAPRFPSHVSVQYFDYPEEITCAATGVAVRIRNDSFQGMSIRLSIVDDYGIPRDLRSLPSSCKYTTIAQLDGSLLFTTPYNGCYVHLVNTTVSMELRIDGIDESERIMVIERIPINCTLPPLVGVTVAPWTMAGPTVGYLPLDQKPVIVTPGTIPAGQKPVNATPGTIPAGQKPVHATPASVPEGWKPVNATPASVPEGWKPVNATPASVPEGWKPVNATPASVPEGWKPVNATPASVPAGWKPVNATPASVPAGWKPVNATPASVPAGWKPVNATPASVPAGWKPVNATPASVPAGWKPVNATPASVPAGWKPVNATPPSVPAGWKPVNATPPSVPAGWKPVNATPASVPAGWKPVNATPASVPAGWKPVNATPASVPAGWKPVNATPASVPAGWKPVNATPGPILVGQKPVNATPGPILVGQKPVNATPGPILVGQKPVNTTAGTIPTGRKPVNATPGTIPAGQKPVNATPESIPLDQKLNGDKGKICDVGAKDHVRCGNATLGELACGAKGCCYDPVNVQTPCFYGKTAYIDCTSNGLFTIVVPRVATVPPLNLGSVSLVNNDSSACAPVARTAEIVVFSFPFNSCGTTQTIDGVNISYEVDVIAKRKIQKGPHGTITRESTFRLHVTCHLTGTRSIPLTLVVNTPSPLPFVVEDGVLQMEMRIAKDKLYGSWFADEDYPIEKFLREPVYVEVRLLHRLDANIVLVLNDCWATQTPEPHHGEQWSILVKGCPYYGDNYLTQLHAVSATSSLQFPTHHKRFEVKTFAFWGRKIQVLLTGEVYLHCSATVCLLSEMEKCATTCDAGKRIARNSDVHTSTEALHQGLVTLTRPIIFTLAEKSVAESSQANGNGILLAAAVTSLALTLICGLVLCWNCKQMHMP